MRWFLIFYLAICFTSCKKAELPVAPHDAGSVITNTVNMDASYKWQIYYDLETNTVVGQNSKTQWDLGFESSAGGFHVVLNSAKAMYAWNTYNVNFASVTDTTGLAAGKRWDEPSGNYDSTAVGNWQGTGHVYIIDRGYNETGIHQGFRKIIFESVDAEKYNLRFATLEGTNDTSFTVYKDSTFNLQFLSFSGAGSVVSIEPPKHTWDLCFTQYLHIFHEPFQPYLVTGCLLNRYHTKALLKTGFAFNDIDYNVAMSTILSNSINSIGYNWKEFSSGVYTVNPSMNYIIQDAEGHFYKLHFTDFYNTSGVKGNPKWEYQQL
ncbi:MAG TPA: HmuY family protein [Flavobacteriales bacterium]|nr:HmuY family protein [Flavobacteriales bacterium]